MTEYNREASTMRRPYPTMGFEKKEKNGKKMVRIYDFTPESGDKIRQTGYANQEE
jgi:hypothetical protein